MKRYLSLMALAVAPFLAASATAQNIELGITAGLDVPNATSTADVAAAARNGIVVGAGLSFPIASPLRLQVEARYVRKGIELGVGTNASSAPTDIYNLNYLEIPVNVKVGLGETFQVYALAGTNVGTLLSATREYRRNDGATSVDEVDDATPVSIALELGGGIAYSVSPRMAITTEARYSYGLVEVGDGDQASLLERSSWKPRDLKLTAGVLFRL